MFKTGIEHKEQCVCDACWSSVQALAEERLKEWSAWLEVLESLKKLEEDTERVLQLAREKGY